MTPADRRAAKREEPHPLLRFLMHFMTEAQLAEVHADMAKFNAAIVEELSKPRPPKEGHQ